MLDGGVAVARPNRESEQSAALPGFLLGEPPEFQLGTSSLDLTRIDYTRVMQTSYSILLALACCACASPTHEPAAVKAEVDQPAYTDKHPKVLFDEGHFNVHTSQRTYQAFVGLLKSDGYEIVMNDKPFAPRTLAGHDVLIISNARGAAQRSEKPAFTEQECDSVRDWVQSGGALLLVVDHYPTGHNAERLAKRFGVELSKGSTVDRANAPEARGGGGPILFRRKNNGLGDHAIMRGRNEEERINCVATFFGQSLKGPTESAALLLLSDSAIDYFPSDAVDNAAGGGVRAGDQPQASAAGRSQGVAFKFGNGRVVVLGEAGHLSARPVGAQRRASGINYEGCDNRQWALNIVHWLSGLFD
jgi:hypothetical protein